MQVARYSPDGQHITFCRRLAGTTEVFVCDGDGRNVTQVTSVGRSGVDNPRWSPDSQFIAFQSGQPGNCSLYVVAMGPDRNKPRQLTSGTYNDQTPSWSRDGQTVYFNSNRSGSSEIWKVPVQGGEPVQVTAGGGDFYQESADGQWGYYYSDTEDPRHVESPSRWRRGTACSCHAAGEQLARLGVDCDWHLFSGCPCQPRPRSPLLRLREPAN